MPRRFTWAAFGLPVAVLLVACEAGTPLRHPAASGSVSQSEGAAGPATGQPLSSASSAGSVAAGASAALSASSSASPASPPPPASAADAAAPRCGGVWNKTAQPKQFPEPAPKQLASLAARCRLQSDLAACLRAAVTASVALPEISWASLPEQVASIDRRGDALSEVTDLSQRACRGGDVAGCAMLGLTELQAGADVGKALGRVEAACTAGYARACRWLGQHHHSPYQADDSKAFAFYDRACALGDVDGCVSGAGARMEFDPAVGGVTPEATEAIRRCGMRMAHELCEAGHAPACMGLGYLHLDGKLAPNPDVALGYFESSCRGGHAPACKAVTDLYGSRAEWERARTVASCPPEPRHAPLTVMPDRVPRLATAEPALVDSVRSIERRMNELQAEQRKLAQETARSLGNGDSQCRGSYECSCIGPVSKCVPQQCVVTRNDGIRLFIECEAENGYSPRADLMNWGLRFARVGDRFVELERLRDLFPAATPMVKTRLVEICKGGGTFSWDLAANRQGSVGQILLAPTHLYAREYADWRSPRCAVRYAALAPLVGCGPLASLAGRAAIDQAPLGYRSAPLAHAAVGSWWRDDGGVTDADFLPFSSYLPAQQPIAASLNAWVQKHHDCEVHLSTAELVSASCGRWQQSFEPNGKPETGPIEQTRLVRLRDGVDVGLRQILTDPRRQLPVVATRCFGGPAESGARQECRLDPACVSRRRDPIDAVPVLTEANVRGFTLDATGVDLRMEASVKQKGEKALARATCHLSYGELGVSLAALGR